MCMNRSFCFVFRRLLSSVLLRRLRFTEKRRNTRCSPVIVARLTQKPELREGSKWIHFQTHTYLSFMRDKLECRCTILGSRSVCVLTDLCLNRVSRTRVRHSWDTCTHRWDVTCWLNKGWDAHHSASSKEWSCMTCTFTGACSLTFLLLTNESQPRCQRCPYMVRRAPLTVAKLCLLHHVSRCLKPHLRGVCKVVYYFTSDSEWVSRRISMHFSLNIEQHCTLIC